MARKTYKYSLDRRDAKLVGVCSTIGAKLGVDPTIVRIAFVAAAIFISFKFTLAAYAGLGIYYVVQRKRNRTAEQRSDFDRMEEVATRAPSVHAMRTELDQTDRRMMAIDHHLNSTNHELAREIDALREDK